MIIRNKVAINNISFEFDLFSNVSIENCRINTTIFTIDGTPIGGVSSDSYFSTSINQRKKVTLSLHDHHLVPGKYYASFSVGIGNYLTGQRDFEVVQQAVFFSIVSDNGSETITPNMHNGELERLLAIEDFCEKHGIDETRKKHLALYIEEFGGKIPDSVGIPEEQPRQAAQSAVCKINIDSDGRLAMTAAIRKFFAENPSKFDPREYLGPAREELKKMYMNKNINVLGSAGHAFD